MKKFGIPFGLQRDDAIFEMIQRIQDIHIDLIMADHWTKLLALEKILLN
jgi:hypothetical protein